MNKEVFKSYLMLCGSTVIWGTMGVFRKYIPLSSSLLAFARGIVGALFLLLFAKLRGESLRFHFEKKTFLLMLGVGFVLGVNWLFLFESYHYTSVAKSTLCYYMQPTILILSSPFVFHERLSIKKICCAMTSIMGMVLVSGTFGETSMNPDNLKGILFGLGAAFFYAMVVVLNKRVKLAEPYVKTIVPLFTASLVMLPYVLFTEECSVISFTVKSSLMVIILGIVHTGVAFCWYFSAMKNVKAQSIAVLGYLDPVTALVVSAFLLGECMGSKEIIGAILIIGSSILSELTVEER